MKTFLAIIGGGVIGILTNIAGFPWFVKAGEIWKLNPTGAFVNIICVLAWVWLMNLIFRD